MPNFADEAEMLEWAGVSFGEEDSYKLQKSMKVFQLNATNIGIEACLTKWRGWYQIRWQDFRNTKRLLDCKWQLTNS